MGYSVVDFAKNCWNPAATLSQKGSREFVQLGEVGAMFIKKVIEGKMDDDRDHEAPPTSIVIVSLSAPIYTRDVSIASYSTRQMLVFSWLISFRIDK